MYYLSAEEGFSLLTGVYPYNAAFRFGYGGYDYFTIRPDFGFLCIVENLNVSPLNIIEEKIKERLFANYQLEIQSIYRAIENGALPSAKHTQTLPD